jgi:hypothetical protein
MATDQKTQRTLTTRETETRYEYKPSSILPDPTPIPGVAFRWVMTALLGVSDATNMSRKMRDGWEPVRAEDHPEMMLPGNKNGNIEIGGLILCSMPEEKLAAQTRYYAKQNQDQMESVDNNFMRDSNPKMAKFSESKSSTTRGTNFGSGTK